MNETSRKALQKIVSHCERVISYTEGMDQDAFASDSRTLEATVFNLSQIGELVRLIEADVVAANPHINWAAMRGLRNRIVHDYDNIRPGVIWATIQNDLPALAQELKQLMG